MDDVDDDSTSSDGEDGSDRPSALDTLVQGLVPCLSPQGVLLLMELDYRGRLHSDALEAWARDNAADLGRRGIAFRLVTAGAGQQGGGVDAGEAALAALRCAARRGGSPGNAALGCGGRALALRCAPAGMAATGMRQTRGGWHCHWSPALQPVMAGAPPKPASSNCLQPMQRTTTVHADQNLVALQHARQQQRPNLALNLDTPTAETAPPLTPPVSLGVCSWRQRRGFTDCSMLHASSKLRGRGRWPRWHARNCTSHPACSAGRPVHKTCVKKSKYRKSVSTGVLPSCTTPRGWADRRSAVKSAIDAGELGKGVRVVHNNYPVSSKGATP